MGGTAKPPPVTGGCDSKGQEAEAPPGLTCSQVSPQPLSPELSPPRAPSQPILNSKSLFLQHHRSRWDSPAFILCFPFGFYPSPLSFFFHWFGAFPAARELLNHFCLQKKIKEKVAPVSDSAQLCPGELLMSPPCVPPWCPGVPTPHPTWLRPPSPHSGPALTCQDLPLDLPNPQIRTLKGQKEGGLVKLGSSGGTFWGDGPFLSPQLFPLFPISNILCVFLVKTILSSFPCKDHFLQGGWEGA